MTEISVKQEFHSMLPVSSKVEPITRPNEKSPHASALSHLLISGHCHTFSVVLVYNDCGNILANGNSALTCSTICMVSIIGRALLATLFTYEKIMVINMLC